MVKRFNAVDVVIIIIISILTISCLVPILNTIAISLSDKTSATLGRVYFTPVGFNTQAYKEILRDQRFFDAFGVSVLRVVLGGSLNVFLSIMLAYPLSKSAREFPMRTAYCWFFVFTMLFNGGLVPNFLLIKTLGQMDTIWALVLPGAVNVFNTLILMNFYKGIPKSLEEAAYVDGAKPFYILFRIFVPLAKASIATIALFSCVNHWNAFFDGKIYINTPARQPLQTYMQSLTFQLSMTAIQNLTPEEIAKKLEMSNITFNASKAIVSMIPIVAIYPFLQNYFVTGVVMGAVKE
ncbi:MAG: carbohydrate ABC transporter permease [Christensenellales bacterium]|jgi:putative aldouronate transport system permease protein